MEGSKARDALIAKAKEGTKAKDALVAKGPRGRMRSPKQW